MQWLRYFALVRRGSSRIFIGLLPARTVDEAGQGGDGPSFIQELQILLQTDSRQREVL